MTPVPTVLEMQHARPAPPGGVAAAADAPLAVVYPAAAPHPSRAQVVPLVGVPAAAMTTTSTTGARFLQPNLQNYQQQAAAMQAADDAQRALDAASTPPGSVVCVASVGDGPAPNVTFDRRDRAFPLALGANALVVALLVLYTWKCAEMHAHVAAAEAGVKQHVGCFRAPNVSASADVSVLQTSSTADGPGVCFVWGFRDLVEGDADYEVRRGNEAHPRANSSQYIGVQARGRPVGGDPGGGGTGASSFLLDDGNEDGGDGRGQWIAVGRYPTTCLGFDAAPEDVFGTDAAVEDCHWDLRGNSATVSVFLNPYRAIPGQVLTNVTLGILMLVFGIVLSVYACIAVVLGGGRNDARCGGADVNYLSNMQSGGIQVYFDAVRREKPELVMKVTCYHYEYRTSHHGKNHRRRRVRVKVITHKESAVLEFSEWWDQSSRMDGVEEYPIAKLKTIKTPLVMFDQTTLAYYKKVRMDLQARNRSKDHHMSYQENQNLKTIKPQTLFVRSLGKLSACCLHRWTFVAWSSCCCNWCYRYALERMSVRAVVHVRKVVKWVPPVAPVAMAGGTVDGALVQLNTMFLSGHIDAAEYNLRKTAMGLSNTPPTAPPIAVEAVPIGAANGGRGGGGGGFGHIARRQTLTRMEALLIRKGVGQDPRPVKAVGCVAILVVGIFTRILIGSVLVYPCSDWAPSTTRSMKHWCEGSRFRYPPFEVVSYWGGDALMPWNRGEATSGWCTAVNAPSASQGDCSCRVDGARATSRFAEDGKTVTSCLGCVEEDIARDDEQYQRCVLRSTNYTGDMSATATTGILCENTCTNAGVLEPLDSEGTCNDPGRSAYPGQFGPATRWTEYNCDFGTDCDDCGPRTYKIGASNNDGGGGSGAAANPFVVLTSSSCCAEGYMPIVIESACETAGHTARVTVPTECSGKSPNACTQKPWGISLVSGYGGPFGCAWQQYGDYQTSKALRFNTFSFPRGAGGKSANTWAVAPFAGQTTPLPATPELQSICAKTWDGAGGDPARAEVKAACEATIPYQKWYYETTGKLAEGTAGDGSVSLLNGLIKVGYIDVGVGLSSGGRRGRGPTAAQNHANCSAAGLWTIASYGVCRAAAQELRRTDAHNEWHADPDHATLNTEAGSTCKCKSDFDDSDRELCWDLETEPASTTTCTWDEPCLCANFTATWEYVALSDGSATSCEALGHTTITDLGECDLARAATDTDHEDLWDPASSSPSAGYTFTVRVSGAGYASGPRGCLRVERGIYHYVVNTDASATGTCDATTTCLCRKG